MDVDARLEALEAENERLRDELDLLKESLGMDFIAPIEWGLTGSETKVFGRLLKTPVATKDALMATLYRDTGRDEAEIKIVDVFICKMRKKLAPFDIEIHTVWGVGYQLTPQSKALFERTWGGAHPVRPYRLGAHFIAAIPSARTINPITHTNWEGVGVIPDIAATPDNALAVAKDLLQRRLHGADAVVERPRHLPHLVAVLDLVGVLQKGADHPGVGQDGVQPCHSFFGAHDPPPRK